MIPTKPSKKSRSKNKEAGVSRDKQEFKRHYLGEFKADPIYQAVRKTYYYLRSRERQRAKLAPPSENIVYHFLKSFENSNSNSEDLLKQFLIYLSGLCDEYYELIIESEKTKASPVYINKELGGGE